MSRSEFSADLFLSSALQKREEQNSFRKLVSYDQLADFCSNDYLGFARSEILKKNIDKECKLYKISNGSGGSRLLAGNSDYVEKLEAKIARFHAAEAGLIYNSGYDANLGLIASIGEKGDTIIYDELIHASVHDGMKLSAATTYLFKHNNLEHLEERLRIAQGLIYVVVESIYSMDGDYAPLEKMVTLCKKFKANFIVDEAHATGVTFNGGRGRVQELKLENTVFARIHTFGKSLGCHGAIVLGSRLLRNFMINFSRPFIYTTALPPKSLIAINQAYLLLQKSEILISQLQMLISIFKNKVSDQVKASMIQSESPVQCIIVSGNDNVKKLAVKLQKHGFDVRPILNPTVSKGKERLRICIHAYNTEKEIVSLCDVVNRYFERIST